MVTRLFLLGALLLGAISPPSAGAMDHCRAQGSAMAATHQMAADPLLDHHGHERHCPPVECTMPVHCVSAATLPLTGIAFHPVVVTGSIPVSVAAVQLHGRRPDPPIRPPIRPL
jgi:hypothetical protein